MWSVRFRVKRAPEENTQIRAAVAEGLTLRIEETYSHDEAAARYLISSASKSSLRAWMARHYRALRPRMVGSTIEVSVADGRLGTFADVIRRDASGWPSSDVLVADLDEVLAEVSRLREQALARDKLLAFRVAPQEWR